MKKWIGLFLTAALLCGALLSGAALGEVSQIETVETVPAMAAAGEAENAAETQEMKINYSFDKQTASAGEVITATWSYENVVEPLMYMHASWLVDIDGTTSTEVVKDLDKSHNSLSLTVEENYLRARLWVTVGDADGKSCFVLSAYLNLNGAASVTPMPATTAQATPQPTAPQDHTHNYEDGVCRICGYQCPHTKTWLAEEGTTTTTYKDTGSNAYHKEENTVSFGIEFCEECDKLVNFKPAETVTLQMGHVYEKRDGQYVCSKCGHVNTCTHEGLTIQNPDLVYEDFGDNRYHRQTLNKSSSAQEAWCEECGVTFDLNELDYIYEKYELHDYRYDVNPNGICAICGHVNTCQHDGMPMAYDGERFFDVGDETYHYLLVTFNESLNETIRSCPDCGREFVYDPVRTGGYPIAHSYDDEGICVKCGHKRVGPVIPNVYALDLSGVTKTNETGGTGIVKRTEGNQPATGLYARVTWVYTLSNEDTFAYCAMKDVIANGDEITFNMVSPKAPYGATLEAVQVALVKDEFADEKGTYEALASAKK